MSSIEKLLDDLDNSRERLLLSLETLPDEALLRNQTVGEWSISDVLNNITAWEAELVTGMMHIRQNKRPDRLLTALKDPESYDAKNFAENQDRDLDQIFADLQQARIQVEDWIAEFSERELSNPKQYQWLKGKALKDLIAEVTYKRERKFIPFIQLFAQQWALVEEIDEPIPLMPARLEAQESDYEETD